MHRRPLYIIVVFVSIGSMLNMLAAFRVGQHPSVANVITGRVADRNGRPVAGAWVIDISREASNETEQLLIGARTDSEGRFWIEHSWRPGKRINVEVRPLTEAFTYYPITPPYSQNQTEAYSSLVSIPLTVSGEPTQDLGTITLDRHFPTISLRLVRKGSQESLDPELIADETLLSFFDKTRNWVASDDMTEIRNEAGVNIEDFSITIGLPPGEWIVALCKEAKCRTTVGETRTFRLEQADKEKKVLLEVED